MSRLVVVTGASLGLGKTTLSRSLSRKLRSELLEEETLIFERPEFAEIGAEFRRGVEPDARQLEAAYGRLVDTLAPSAGVTMMAQSFVELAEDLQWALADEAALHAHSRRMRDVLSALSPLILFLDGDVAEGLRRRESEKGREWFAAYDDGARSDEPWELVFARLEERFSIRRTRILTTFEAGGWTLETINVLCPPNEVLQAALNLVASHV